MSRFLQYTFPAGNTTAVCKLQTLTEAGSLTFDGDLSNQVGNYVSFASKGYSRAISLTSENDLSGVNFTISGVQNGVNVSEVLAGPDNDTVYSTLIYDTVFSISSNGAVDDVSAGTGWEGAFLPISINLEREVINYSLALSKTTAANVGFAVYGTLDFLLDNQSTLQQNITDNSALFPIEAMGADPQYIYSNIAHPLYAFLVVKLGENVGTIANGIKLTFRQT